MEELALDDVSGMNFRHSAERHHNAQLSIENRSVITVVSDTGKGISS